MHTTRAILRTSVARIPRHSLYHDMSTSRNIISKTLLKHSSPHLTRMQQLYRSASSSSSEDLSTLINREMSEEKQNSIIPEELAQLKSQVSENWIIVDESGGDGGLETGATIKMFKKDSISGGGKVAITFHCQDTIDGDGMGGSISDMFGGSEEVREEEDEEEDDEDSSAARFTVTITKAGKIMRFSAVAEGVDVSTESVCIMDEGCDLDEEVYQGPEFLELAEDLQEAFNKYLSTDCGVNEDVAVFISMYADFKEQTEYRVWLKNASKMISS